MLVRVVVLNFYIHFISILAMKRRTPIFTSLEDFNGSKYPTFIKDILIATAFDSEATLGILTKNSVELIESIVNENKELLKDTRYVDNEGNFKISPINFCLATKLCY